MLAARNNACRYVTEPRTIPSELEAEMTPAVRATREATALDDFLTEKMCAGRVGIERAAPPTAAQRHLDQKSL